MGHATHANSLRIAKRGFPLYILLRSRDQFAQIEILSNFFKFRQILSNKHLQPNKDQDYLQSIYFLLGIIRHIKTSHSNLFPY